MVNSQRLCFHVVLSVGLVLAALPSVARVAPFGYGTSPSDPRLSATDMNLLMESVSRLNSNPQSVVGSEEEWFNPATGSRGKSRISRILTNAGRPCHEIHHELLPLGLTPPRIYNLTWCRVPDGAWKIKS
jgi:hypothetical protein